MAGGARGEAGWSGEWRKRSLTDVDGMQRTRRWREYCCESFCDTGSVWAGANSECTLARKWLAARLKWFQEQLDDAALPI